MDQNLMKRQRELTDRLNRYRNEYYNLNSPSVSDASKPLFPGSFISSRTKWGTKVFTCSITLEKSETTPTS